MKRGLLGAAAALVTWGLVVAVTGGVDQRVLGIAIRSRDPFRALLAGVALFLVAAVAYRDDCADAMDRIAAFARRFAPALALVAGLALAMHAIVFGTLTAGGSDSYGYVSQAYGWVSGALPKALPIPLSLPFEASDLMQQPLGYRIGPTPHTLVPTYAPGLPLLMAIGLLIVGGPGPFLVVPICSALFVWYTFKLGRMAGGAVTGVLAALVLITSPIILFQSLQPMSDIPAGAMWTAACVHALGGSRRSAFAAGLWAAVGLLVRPNLPLVATAVFVTVAFSARGGRERVLRAVLFSLPILPVVAFVAKLNAMWYGSPLNSGYGSAHELYALANVWPNVRLYMSWLWESQSPWLLLALVPWLPPLGRSFDRPVLLAAALLASATLASYLAYFQWDYWWYLRFLLPGVGALSVMIACGIVVTARAVRPPFGRVAAVAALGFMVTMTLSYAVGKNVFGRIAEGERRYIDIGAFVADRLPENTILFSMQHSGSLRFYSGRHTLRYDWVNKDWAAGVPAATEHAGFHPYLVVDDGELPAVREHFGLPADSVLPWPVVGRTLVAGGVTVFDMASTPSPVAPTAIESPGRTGFATLLADTHPRRAVP